VPRPTPDAMDFGGHERYLGLGCRLLVLGLILGVVKFVGGAVTRAMPVAYLGAGVLALAALLALVLLVWLWVAAALLLHRGWSLFEGRGDSLAPGTAVLLMCVPIVNGIWCFHAVGGLRRRMNDCIREHGLEASPIPLYRVVFLGVFLLVPPLQILHMFSLYYLCQDFSQAGMAIAHHQRRSSPGSARGRSGRGTPRWKPRWTPGSPG
jgi:hypothetical protein